MRTLTLLALLSLFASADNKPLALHPDNPHYFLFRDKPAILVGSTEHYGAVMNLDFDYLPYLEELAKNHLNQTRTFSGTYREVPGSFGITDNTLSPTHYIGPWPLADNQKYNLTQYNEKYFARLKDFLTQASRQGVVVEYVLFCTLYNDALWDINPMNPKNHSSNIGSVPRREVFTLKHPELLALQDAFVKKAVTELNSFDNVYFEICNEPYFEGVSDEWQAHIAQTILETEKNLPNHHLIAQNIANDKKKIDKSTPGVSIFNFHYATPPETVEMNYALNLPIADDETGFKGKDDIFYRTEGWDFFIAGGAAYNNLDYSFTAKHPAGTLKDFKSPGGGSPELRQSLGAIKTLFDHIDFIHMKPMNQIIKSGSATANIAPPDKAGPARALPITVRVLGKEGQAYILYIRGGRKIDPMLILPKGQYWTTWVDTQTGNFKTITTFGHEGGEKAFESPLYNQDIALLIFNSRTTPVPAQPAGAARDPNINGVQPFGRNAFRVKSGDVVLFVNYSAANKLELHPQYVGQAAQAKPEIVLRLMILSDQAWRDRLHVTADQLVKLRAIPPAKRLEFDPDDTQRLTQLCQAYHDGDEASKPQAEKKLVDDLGEIGKKTRQLEDPRVQMIRAALTPEQIKLYQDATASTPPK